MALITALPTLIGPVLRAMAKNFVLSIGRSVSMIANVLFVIIIVGTIFANRELFLANLDVLGPLLANLCMVMLALGYFAANGSGQPPQTANNRDLIRHSNAGVAITVANLATGYTVGFSDYSLIPAIYGVVMCFAAAPFILWWRRIS